MDCLVEDFVYDDINTTSNQLINAGLNNLFGEVIWFYCTSGSMWWIEWFLITILILRLNEASGPQEV
jgi:hypothetical protein